MISQETFEPRLDPKSLPNDNALVEWQTYADVNKEEWQQGIYNAEDLLFAQGFVGPTRHWSSAFEVIQWRYWQATPDNSQPCPGGCGCALPKVATWCPACNWERSKPC
jgi:hypothetical protein